jgi:hypothetical protein
VLGGLAVFAVLVRDGLDEADDVLGDDALLEAVA